MLVESHVFDVIRKLNLKNLLSQKVLVPQGIHNGVSIIVVIQRKLFGHHIFGLVVSKTITLTSEKKRDTAISAVGTKKELFLCTPSQIVPLTVKVVKFAEWTIFCHIWKPDFYRPNVLAVLHGTAKMTNPSLMCPPLLALVYTQIIKQLSWLFKTVVCKTSLKLNVILRAKHKLEGNGTTWR